ncbi:MAG: DEAD/DEAH box helicase [Clostridia bacterium]|nr:DEAD/DEAH box helicase [Clostridia bacterium]
MESLFFKDINLSTEVQKAIAEMGFEEATPIQSRAIPHILAGADIIGQALTGTGKTCAFGIPAVEMIDSHISDIQVLILCPTRELAVQVSEEIQAVCKFKSGIKVLPIYGGQSIERQILALKRKPQIIVGTPGRVMDHMRRRTLKFPNLRTLILDEADEMLNMGFREDIDVIIQELPKDRQTLLFSATMSPEIKQIAKEYLNKPEHILTVHKELTIPSIEQFYIEVRESSKLELLCRLIDAKNIKLGLVFCNTKKRVDELTMSLQGRGYSAEALHGDMKQSERTRVMTKFKKGAIDILVATDVAARGIDVENIEAVFNYDIPSDEEYYVHRIGRTARAGKKGISYSFVFGRDMYKLREIQKFTNSVILPMQPPKISDIEEMKLEAATKNVVERLEAGGYSKYDTVIENILMQTKEATTLDVASVLFKLAFEELDRGYEASDLDKAETQYRKADMVRLFLNIGTMDHVQAKNLVQAIASETSLSKKVIGDVDIRRQFSFVEVPAEHADKVINAMVNFTYRGRTVSIEKASKRQRPKGNGRTSGGRKKY